MRLPSLNEIYTQRDMVDVFGGYNHNLRIGSGEFYDMKNLSSSHYPVLSPCSKKGVYAEPSAPQGLISKDTLCYVDGRYFVANEKRIDMGLSEDEDMCPKTLVSMGAYVIIMPDKMYINTKDFTDFGAIEAKVVTASEVTFSLCKSDGSVYENALISASAPTDPENMDLWIDTSSTPHSLKQYSSTTSQWVSIATTYVKISATGIGVPFSAYDSVDITGIESNALSDLNNNMIVWERGDDYIVVTGILDAVTTQAKPITISRTMPHMDFIIESENRLWGCRYGVASNGEVVNEIYASKLGDFKNWKCYMGLSTDSYAATVGTDGQFTGAIAHMGYPIFFKENCMHKVYGNFPANYQIITTTCRGVQKGSHKSLAVVNEVLYYKSRSSICAFDGSLPQEISYPLGDVIYSDAVAGSFGSKYYISMLDNTDIVRDKDGNILESCWHLFAYDTAKGMWHREDSIQAEDFCECRGELYYIDHYDKKIKTINGTGTVSPSKIEWMAETGIIGTDSPDKKYISKVTVRMALDLGTRVLFFIQYDSIGEWEYITTMSGATLRSISVPIKPKRCDHFRIRIEGTGDAKVFSLTKTIEQGSDA